MKGSSSERFLGIFIIKHQNYHHYHHHSQGESRFQILDQMGKKLSKLGASVFIEELPQTIWARVLTFLGNAQINTFFFVPWGFPEEMEKRLIFEEADKRLNVEALLPEVGGRVAASLTFLTDVILHHHHQHGDQDHAK